MTATQSDSQPQNNATTLGVAVSEAIHDSEHLLRFARAAKQALDEGDAAKASVILNNALAGTFVVDSLEAALYGARPRHGEQISYG